MREPALGVEGIGRILEADEIGPGGHGSSEAKDFGKCPQLYAYRRFVWGPTGSVAQTLGSAVHYMLALHYLRVQARQLAREGHDPETWAHPIDGLHEACRRGVLGPLTPEQFEICASMYAARFNPEQSKGPKVLYVEAVLPVDMGADLDVPGHPEHGKRIVYASRVDLVCEGSVKTADGGRKVWVTEHKTASSVNPKTVEGYLIDFQILFHALVGQSHFGDRFGGVMLHLLETREPYVTETVQVPPAPFALSRAVSRYVELRHAVARLELETLEGRRTVYDWPAALHETVCVGRYDRCTGYDLCRLGPASVSGRKLNERYARK